MVPIGTEIMCLQLDEGLQLQNPAGIRGGEVAVVAALNTWPVILLGTAIVVMLMLSTKNGARAFSFALSYTNLWFFWGKRGRFRVRVQSFASNDGSGCFLTTSGEFTSGLEDEEQNEEEEADGVARLDQNGSPGSGKSITGRRFNYCDDGNSTNGSIVRTDMIFTYGSCTSLFAAGNEATGRSSGPTFHTRLLVEGVHVDAAVSDGLEDVFGRHSRDEVPELLRMWDFDQRDLHRTTEELSIVVGEMNRSKHPVTFKNSAAGFSRKTLGRRTAVVRDYPWDVEMKLRLSAQYRKHESVPAAQDSASIYCSSSVVVGGVNRTATLNKNMVKIWENSSRRVMVALPPPPILSSCTEGGGLAWRTSSLDVNWENEAVCLGSSDGFLSLWDLERASCASIVSCHRRKPGPIRAVCFSNASTTSAGISDLIVTAEECGGAGSSRCSVSLWDSRILNGATAAVDSIILNNYSPVPLCEMTVDSFELVVRNCFDSSIASHDIRMLKSSPLVLPSLLQRNEIKNFE